MVIKNCVLKGATFLFCILAITSCGSRESQTDAHLNGSRTIVPLKIEVTDFKKYDNPMLAEELVNQLATSLNYYLQAPFSERTKVSGNDVPWLKLTDLSMNNTGRTNVDSKNNLKVNVKSGIFGGSVTVNYTLKQKYYTITLKFEDYAGNVYRYSFYLWVNEETIVNVSGKMDLEVGLGVLGVLPGDVGHSLVSGLGELFTISADSSNNFEWYESLAPMMKPLLPGIVSNFQVQIIGDVFIPLCRKMNDNNDSGLDCSLPNLEPSNVVEALTLKLRQWDSEKYMMGSPYPQGRTSSTFEEANGDFYDKNYVGKNSIESKAYYLSRCVNSGLKVYGQERYNVFMPMLNGRLYPKEYDLFSLYLKRRGGWERVPFTAGQLMLVQESSKVSCSYSGGSEVQQCMVFYLDVSSRDKEQFESMCDFINLHGSSLDAGIGISLSTEAVINDADDINNEAQVFF